MLRRSEVDQLNNAKAAATAGTATSDELMSAARLFFRENLWPLTSHAFFTFSTLEAQRASFTSGDAAALVDKINAVLGEAVDVANAPAKAVAGAVGWIFGTIAVVLVVAVLTVIAVVSIGRGKK